MASVIDLKDIVKHIANGSLAESVCRICLKPLDKHAESVFTKICKQDYDYCIADILKNISDIEVSPNEHHQVCSKCFILASLSYKFYLLSKQTDEILHFYVDELLRNISDIDIIVPQNITSESLCIPLPMINPIEEYYSIDLNQISRKLSRFDNYEDSNSSAGVESDNELDQTILKNEANDLDDHAVMILDEAGEACYYKTGEDGCLVQISESESKKYIKVDEPQKSSEPENKVATGNKRRKRKPVLKSKACLFCSAKFKFVTKLQQHTKEEHGVDIFMCKLCKKMILHESNYNDHLLHAHDNILKCDYCGAIFRKRNIMISHIKYHLTLNKMTQNNKVHVCENCGSIFISLEELKEHIEQKHEKKHTCFYCGKQYKGLVSLEGHIKKHEMYMNNESQAQDLKPKPPKREGKHACTTCGRGFVDERSLMWHTRLHTNERPFVCEVCGRGFVSANRRSQHALCSHSAPAKRCPLCPAVFHLRSMVNSHIKKVHLRGSKKRARGMEARYARVSWHTAPVPLPDLSVALQHRVLALQAP